MLIYYFTWFITKLQTNYVNFTLNTGTLGWLSFLGLLSNGVIVCRGFLLSMDKVYLPAFGTTSVAELIVLSKSRLCEWLDGFVHPILDKILMAGYKKLVTTVHTTVFY